MKGKILENEYIEELGYSMIKKATPYGVFQGEAFVHPDDKDIANSWDGMAFAEMKCDIQAAKEKAKAMRQRALGVKYAYQNLCQACVNDPSTLHNLERQVWAFEREADKYKEIYEEMRDAYPAFTQYALDRRRNLRKKVADSKK